MEVFIQRAESRVYVFALKDCWLTVSRKFAFSFSWACNESTRTSSALALTWFW